MSSESELFTPSALIDPGENMTTTTMGNLPSAPVQDVTELNAVYKGHYLVKGNAPEGVAQYLRELPYVKAATSQTPPSAAGYNLHVEFELPSSKRATWTNEVSRFRLTGHADEIIDDNGKPTRR